MTQRLVHIGNQRSHLAAVRGANGYHLAGQLQRAVQILHKRAVTHRDIQQDGVRPGGQLFGHNGGSNQRDAAHRGGHIAQGIHLFVCHRNLSALAND